MSLGLSPVWHRLRVRRKSATAYTLALVLAISLLAGLLHSCVASLTTQRATQQTSHDLEANLSPAARCALHCAANAIGAADVAANRTVSATRKLWSRLAQASSAAKATSDASMANLMEEASRASSWIATSSLARQSEQSAKVIQQHVGEACHRVATSAEAAKCRAMACCAAVAHSLAGAAEVIAESAEKASSSSHISQHRLVPEEN